MRLLEMLRERAREEHVEIQAALAEEREKDRIAAVLREFPQIGVLMREGKAVYYIHHGWETIEEDDPEELRQFLEY